MVIGQARSHTVVHYHAILAEHETIAAAAEREFRPTIGIDPVQELGSIGPADIDLAQRRRVKHADAGARCQALPVDGLLHAFAGAWIVPGPFPLTDVLENSIVFDVPAVQCGLAHRVETLNAQTPTSDGTEGYRRVIGSKGGRAGVGQ